MIYRTPAKASFRQAQIRCNLHGAFVTVKWSDYGSSAAGPAYDPTTGAQLTDAEYLIADKNTATPGAPIVQLNPNQTWNYLVENTGGPGSVASLNSFRTRAFTKFVAPTESRSRMFAEIRQGDCIMDFIIPILQVATPGDTTLAVGQLIDIFQFGAANRALATGQTPATKMPNCVDIASLKNPSVWMYKCQQDWENDVNGQEWIQQTIGEDLARSWESIYAGELLGQAMLLRKAT